MSVVKFSETPRRSLKRRHGYSARARCSHRGEVLVDTQAREVECAKCGAVLDPITVLGWLATEALEADHRAVEFKRLVYALAWVMAQPGGRVVMTESRTEVRVGTVTKTSSTSACVERGGMLERLKLAIESAKETVEWAARKEAR